MNEQHIIAIKPEHRQEIERRAADIQRAQAEAARLFAQAQQHRQMVLYAQEALTVYLEREYHLTAIGEQWNLDLARGMLVCGCDADAPQEGTQEELSQHVQ